MARNEFQGSLYRTHSQMLYAIAETWLEAGGLNDREIVARGLSEMTDEQLAVEVIEAWGLGQTDGDDLYGEPSPSHMDREGYDADDLAEAFAWFRASFQAEAS